MNVKKTKIICTISDINCDVEFIRELYENGFEITEERTAQSAGKTYTVMLVIYTGRKQEIDDSFAFFGKNKDDIYIESVKEKLRKMAKGNERYKQLL